MPACPHCSNTRTHKDGRDRAGKQRYRCSSCRCSFTDRTGTPFTHHRWPRDVIVMAVRWYFSYRLSAANVRNLLAERGLDVSRQTVADWVQKFGVLLAEAGRRYAIVVHLLEATESGIDLSMEGEVGVKVMANERFDAVPHVFDLVEIRGVRGQGQQETAEGLRQVILDSATSSYDGSFWLRRSCSF